MEVSRQTDINDIQRLLFQHFFIICVGMFPGIFFKVLCMDIAEGSKAGFFHCFPYRDVCAADAAHAYKSDF